MLRLTQKPILSKGSILLFSMSLKVYFLKYNKFIKKKQFQIKTLNLF